MHDTHAHAKRMHKRQATTATTRRRVTTTILEETPLAQVAAVTTTSTSAGRYGIANTGTGTRIAPTAPPTKGKVIESGTYSYTFATRASSYQPGVVVPAHSAGGLSSGTIVATADGSSSSNTSSSAGGFQLSTPVLVGIIAGGSAVVVIIAIIAGCCCWKRKKAKKEAAWKRLNESQSSIAAYNIGVGAAHNPAAGTGVSANAGHERTRAMTASEGREKAWSGAWDGQEKASVPQQERLHQYQYPPRDRHQLQQQQQQQQRQQQQFQDDSKVQQQQTQYAFIAQEQQNLAAARAELFASGQRAQSIGSEFNNGVISFSGAPAPSVQRPSTRNLTDMTALSSTSLASTAGETGRQPSVAAHRWRPSEVPAGAFVPPLTRDERQQVEDRDHRVEDRFRQVITGVVGRPDSAAIEAEEREIAREVEAQSMAAREMEREVEEARRQEELRRKKNTIANFADAYGDHDEAVWSDEQPSTVPPKRTASRRKTNGLVDSAPPSTSVTRRQPTGARYSSRVDSKPLRELEDILDSFHTGPSHQALPALPTGSSSSGSSSGSSQRTQSVLSGVSSIGPLAVARSNGPTRGSHSELSSLTELGSTRSVQPHYSSPLTTVVETTAPSPRLARNASLERRLPSSRSDDGPLQSTPPLSSPLHMSSSTPPGLQNSPTSSEVPSWGHSAGPSPATTPLTPQFDSKSPWDRAGEHLFLQQQQQTQPSRKQQQQAVVAMNGFEPLSSLAPDTSYRSATLSIYGMYDDDDAPELKGLPLDDPRVSRHQASHVPGSRGLV